MADAAAPLEQVSLQEALENTPPAIAASPSPAITSPTAMTRGRRADSDAENMVIGSLRQQIQDLITQVTQLNSKLVTSYDRVSDLEDDLHVANANLRTSSVKISQLELERTQHLSALNTGLLVERTQVTAELTRLMEKATEEAAQRGAAESARNNIEKDLDDLSASLFDQANTMVAEARFARAVSERKVEESERALRGAEEAVAVMQAQMQEMQAEKDKAERRAETMRIAMGKGKWIERDQSASVDVPRALRLLSTHAPYQEFMLFVAHLRTLHLSSPHPPAMTTLIPLPFLARLITEDSEPTVRLDLAPSLNWLSRRSVLAAIHSGQLTIEPIPVPVLLQELAASSGSSSPNVSCALCGTAILPSHDGMPTMHRTSSGNVWTSPLKFKKSFNYGTSPSPPTTPPATQTTHGPLSPSSQGPTQIYVFRIAQQTPASAISSLPVPLSLPSSSPSTSYSPTSPQPSSTHHLTPSQQQKSALYPLCTSGWCLRRLRTTCSLWAFVRAGVVERVWDEEVPNLPAPPVHQRLQAAANGAPAPSTNSTNASTGASAKPPPVPPRRRGLWSMASALGERAAANWTGDKDGDKKKPAPPLHPTQVPKNGPVHNVPPPLPKRNESRMRTLSSIGTKVEEKPAEVHGDENGEEKEKEKEKEKETEAPEVKEKEAPGAKVEETVSDAGERKEDQNKADAETSADSDAADAGAEKAATTDAEEPALDGTAAPAPTTELAAPAGVDAVSPAAEVESAFGTPTDEINDPLATAGDPDTDTKTETPATPTVPAPATPTAPSASPEASAPLSATSNVDGRESPAIPRPESPAVRTGSPAPPPIPRRAAARRVPPAPPAGGVAPAPAADSARPPAGAVEATSTPATEPSSEPAAEPVASPTAEPAPVDGVPSGAAKHESTPSDPLQADGTAKSHASPNEGSAEDGDIGATEAPVAINGRHSVTAPQSESDEPPAPPPPETKVNGTAAKEDPGRDADGQAFVGTATWEERTWTTLVELREDMFWARIGRERS